MMRGAILALLLSLAAVVAAADSTPPWFCHGLDCPEFEVKQSWPDEGLELRSYKEGTWASTNITDMRYDGAVRVAFMVRVCWGRELT
jgi:hypothetical protein